LSQRLIILAWLRPKRTPFAPKNLFNVSRQGGRARHCAIFGFLEARRWLNFSIWAARSAAQMEKIRSAREARGTNFRTSRIHVCMKFHRLGWTLRQRRPPQSMKLLYGSGIRDAELIGVWANFIPLFCKSSHRADLRNNGIVLAREIPWYLFGVATSTPDYES
jgi:hypothetical protein